MEIDYKKLRPEAFSLSAYESANRISENVRNKSGYKIVSQCPICTSHSVGLELVKFDIPLYLCNCCSVSFAGAHPRNFDDVYSTEGYLTNTLGTYDATREYRKRRFGTERVNLIKEYAPTGDLLDVGCGSGWFLEVARDYYSVLGVEYSDTLRTWLKSELGIDSFKTLGEIEKKFDVITAFDLIEHVDNPIGMLKTMRSALKPNGAILIYTPNKDSLSFYVTGDKNNLICPPQHLYYFNFKSLTFAAKAAGLSCVYYKTYGTDVDDMQSFFDCWCPERDVKISNPESFQNNLDLLGMANHARYVLKAEGE